MTHAQTNQNTQHNSGTMTQTKSKPVVSNWQKLKGKLVKDGIIKPKTDNSAPESVETEQQAKRSKKQKVREENLQNVNSQKLRKIDKAKYIGLDCEMVGLGMNGKESALARCCLVDFDGNIVYDKFVRPKGFVTDFRTKWSGVRKSDLRMGQAVTFEECQQEVAELMKGKILVGHALKNDLDVLMLSHPRLMIRDTAKYKPYMRVHGRHGKMRPRALRDLTVQFLGIKIQGGEHNPAEDANSAMTLYRLAMEEWESGLRESRLKAKLGNKEGKKSVTDGTASVESTVAVSSAKNATAKRKRSDSADSVGGVSGGVGSDSDAATDDESTAVDGTGKVAKQSAATEVVKPAVKKTKQQLADEEISNLVKSLYEQNYNSNDATETTVVPPKPTEPLVKSPAPKHTGVKRKAGSMFTDNSSLRNVSVTPTSSSTSTSSPGTRKGVSFADGGNGKVQTKVKSIAEVDREMAAKKAKRILSSKVVISSD